MNPDWLEKLLHILETADGSVPMNRPDVIPQARTIGPALPGNIPVPQSILDALPNRKTRADKIIGALADMTPVGGVESIKRAYQLGTGGDQAGATRELINAGFQLAPMLKGGKIESAAEGYWHDAHIPSAAADSAAARSAPYVIKQYGRSLEPNAITGRLTTTDGKWTTMLDPHEVSQWPGLRGEHNRIDAEKVAKLTESIKQNGFDPEHAIAVDVINGKPVIYEGNHRARAAAAAGVPVPAEVRYLGMSERRANPFIPREFAPDQPKAYEVPAKYAILTAENPRGISATPERNAQYNRALEKHLDKAGIKYDKVLGAYTDETSGQALKENSYLLHDIDPAQAERIGRQFGQNGVVTHAGYHNLAEGKLHPTSGLSDADGGIYTQLPDGRRVISNIDWEKNNPLASTVTDSVDAPLARTLYHSTNAAFDRFDTQKSELGAHFGTPEQARAVGGKRTVAARLSLQNPLRLVDNGDFSPDAVSAQLVDKGLLTDAQADRIRRLPEPEAIARLQAKIREHGHDGVVYLNRREGASNEALDFVSDDEFRKAIPHAQDSYIAFHPDQISIADAVQPATDSTFTRAGKAISDFKHTAGEIRNFPDQRRQDMIDALRGEAYMRPQPYGPAVITRDRWKPTSRGVFDRTPGSELLREPAPLEFTAKAKPKSTGLHPAAEQIANDPRVVKRILSDVEKGRDQGGIGWYGLAPVRDLVEELGGNFRDFNMAGAAGSARTPTHNELTNMSLNLFGRANGLDTEGARAAFLERFPNTMRPTYMNTHRQIFDRGIERGVLGPNNPADGALKIPHYFHNRMLGANGVPIDTHEMRMMEQATGISMDDIKAAMKAGGNNYEAMTQPYQRVAEQLGLTPDQVQASRWLGGGLETGLKSQPKGDFMQTLEDGLLYTARTQGLDESPKGLRNLFGRIINGQDFFLPTPKAGGFPVY